MTYDSLISYFPCMDDTSDLSTDNSPIYSKNDFTSKESNLIISFLESRDSGYIGKIIEQPAILQRTPKVYHFVRYTSDVLYNLFIRWAQEDATTFQSSSSHYCLKCYIQTESYKHQLCCKTYCENCQDYLMYD